MSEPTPVLDAHRERLHRAFASELAARRPESVLDVGCGEGLLLEVLDRAGIRAAGVEARGERVERARARGCDVELGDAHALGHGDRSFDVVVIRHVLHHLADPAGAVREACRVARSGVVLAEPVVERSIPSQAAMALLDGFLSRLEARAGHVHEPYVPAGGLLSCIERSWTHAELRTFGELTAIPPSEVRALAEKSAHGIELTTEESEELERWVEEADAGGVTASGSCAVFVTFW